MSFTVTLSSSPSSSSSSSSCSESNKTHRFNHYRPNKSLTLQFYSYNSNNNKPLLLKASRRNSSANSNTVNGPPRNWSRSINTQLFDHEFNGGDDADEDDDDEEDEGDDRSLDLLVKFIQNVFKKVSKRARKAVRSVLPISISTKLVGFSVNGVLILAFLWVLKAFLEVVCTLGTVVFASILLIRGVWSGITYLQEGRYLKMNGLDDDHHEWTGAQPAT